MHKRPQGNSPSEQLIKYQAHKRANTALKHFIEQGNLIAAYVIAFSIFEDKARAYFIVMMRDVADNQDWKRSKFRAGISRNLEYLLETKAINKGLFNRANKVVKQRNTFIHATMYNVDFFTVDHVAEVVELRNEFAKLLQATKRALRNARATAHLVATSTI